MQVSDACQKFQSVTRRSREFVLGSDLARKPSVEGRRISRTAIVEVK